MSLLFLTGNAHKLTEAQQLIPVLTGWSIDLPEIQERDARRIIEMKLLEAARLQPTASLIVEDTSLYLDVLNGLPGPLIKWFIAPDALGLRGLAELALAKDCLQAQATTWIGLLERSDAGTQIQFFEGCIQGQVHLPRGEQGFGWDPIFTPTGSLLSFAEMSLPEKQRFSMRRLAFEKLAAYLANNS